MWAFSFWGWQGSLHFHNTEEHDNKKTSTPSPEHPFRRSGFNSDGMKAIKTGQSPTRRTQIDKSALAA
jgi:hypothetical protein